MKQVMETFFGTFLLMFLIVSCFGCLMAAINARNADKYKTEYIMQLEDSDFATGVAKKIFEDAAEHEYRITMQVYKDLGGTMTITPELTDYTQFQTEVGDTTGTYMIRLTLTFDYSFPLMDVFTAHTLLGYAK